MNTNIFLHYVRFRQMETLENSVSADIKMILSILRQQHHGVKSGELMPEPREVSFNAKGFSYTKTSSEYYQNLVKLANVFLFSTAIKVL